jgi:hypothetical protein
MQAAIKMKIFIPADHHVELSLPESLPTGPAEVIVLTTPQNAEVPPRQGMGMDAGKGWVAVDFDAPLPEEIQRLFEGGV